MKRNKESKYRIKVISFKRMNKERQKHLDEMTKRYKFTYKEIYKSCLNNDYSKIIEKIYMDELLENLKHFDVLKDNRECSCITKNNLNKSLRIDFDKCRNIIDRQRLKT